MEEEYTNILTLTDLDGGEIDFEILDLIPYQDSQYAVLLPVDDDSDDPEAVILEVFPAGDDEEDNFQGVENEAVLDAVFNLFIERNKDDFQFEQ